METINVIYQSDDNYAPYMGISIYSLLENNANVKEKINIYIIDDEISEENKEIILSMAGVNREIIFLDTNIMSESNAVKDFALYNGERKNRHSFYKLFMAELLPCDVHRILYVDCDTLITGRIDRINDIEMQGNVIGMVYDSLIFKAKESIGMNISDAYFNSGVILIDLDMWKRIDVESLLISNLKEHGQYGTVDQDVLNVALFGKIFPLPMEYNVQPHHIDFSIKSYFKVFPKRDTYYSEEEIHNAVEFPIVVHFFRYLGKSPWDKKNHHPDTKLFDEYQDKSPWKGWPKRDRKVSFVNKIEIFLYLILPRTLYFRIFVYFHERMIISSNRI